MKLHLLNRSSVLNESFRVTHNKHANFLRVWHYHPEFELVIILKSTGTRFIGDSIQKFNAAEVVLIGANLPHMWLNDEIYFQEESKLSAEAVAIHFKHDFLGTDFFNLPEMQGISKLLYRASRGILFQGLSDTVMEDISTLAQAEATVKVHRLIKILDILAKHQTYNILASTSFLQSFHKTGNKRLDTIYEYVFQYFNTQISSSDVAKVAGMNKSAFSRFFKETHKKTFTTYLNELRVGYAAKMLVENKESITEIAYLSGFNNISNFNRQFKNIHNQSPSSYLKHHKQK